MAGTITFKGRKLSLLGRRLSVARAAPLFRVVNGGLEEVSLPAADGKVKLLTSFPSLDTPVCDAQVKEFNKRAAGVSDQVTVLAISKDLPFAQKRFCDTFDVKDLLVFSDYKYSSFGINYGLLIRELGLLARSVWIVDKNNIIRYVQIVDELTSPPDYARALAALADILKSPASLTPPELPSRCAPCEQGALPLTPAAADKLLQKYSGWELVEGKKIKKTYKFSDFLQTKAFLDLVAFIAEEQGHHPSLAVSYNKLTVTLSTHAAGGLTGNDFIVARAIDEIGGEL